MTTKKELQPYKNFWNKQLQTAKQLETQAKKDQAAKSAEIKKPTEKT